MGAARWSGGRGREADAQAPARPAPDFPALGWCLVTESVAGQAVSLGEPRQGASDESASAPFTPLPVARASETWPRHPLCWINLCRGAVPGMWGVERPWPLPTSCR